MFFLIKAHNNFLDKDLAFNLRCSTKKSFDNYLEREVYTKGNRDFNKLIKKRFTSVKDGDIINITKNDNFGNRENYPRFYKAYIDDASLFLFFKTINLNLIKSILCNKNSPYVIDTKGFKEDCVNVINSNRIIERKKKKFDFSNCVPHCSAGTYTIKPSGGNYTNLFDWEAGEQCDLTGTAGCIADCYSLEDTTKLQIVGWTTTTTARITVQATATARHSGVWTTDCYRQVLRAESGADSIDIKEEYVTFDGLQFWIDDPAVQYCSSIYITAVGASNETIIKNCIIRVESDSGTQQNFGIYADNAQTILRVENCVIYGDNEEYGTGIVRGNASSINIRNTVISKFLEGVRTGCVLTNCAIFRNGDDFAQFGTWAITYTASDDNDKAGTGNFQITQTASDYAALVVNAAGGNFAPTNASSELVNTASNLTETFTNDCRGYTRVPTGSWDIGAFALNNYSASSDGIKTGKKLINDKETFNLYTGKGEHSFKS